MKQIKTCLLCLLAILFASQSALAENTISITANSSTPQTRNPAMVTFISEMNAEIAGFGESTPSKWFAFSFDNLNQPNQVIHEIKLHLHLSALSENLSYNDMILLYLFENDEIFDAWDSQIGSDGPTTGILPFRWELGQTHRVTLNLKELMCRLNKTLFKAVKEKGFLDVIVQDDTMVDQLELEISYKDEARLSMGEAIEISKTVIHIPLMVHNPDHLEIQGFDFQLSIGNTARDMGFCLSDQLKQDYGSQYNMDNHKGTIGAADLPFFSGDGEIGIIKIQLNPPEARTYSFCYSLAQVDQRPVLSTGLEYNIPNLPPVVEFIADQTMLEDSIAASISFTVIDEDPSSLTWTTMSDDQTLISDSQIVVRGANSNKQLLVTPNKDAHGSVNITIVARDPYGLEGEATFKLVVINVNDAPEFTLKTIPKVDEDSGQQNISDFIVKMNPGPNESDQTIEVLVHVDDSSLFSKIPEINDKTLSYMTGENRFGSVNLTVCAKDNGGTLFNGVDQLCESQPLVISPVNDPPEFSLKTNKIECDAKDGSVTLNNFLQNVSSGPYENGQSLQSIKAVPDRPELFEQEPLISLSNYELSFTPKSISVGETIVTIRIQDKGDGDNISAPQTLAISMKGYTLSGIVSYYHDRKTPVPEVKMELIGPVSLKLPPVFSDSSGFYIFKNLPKEKYTIQVSKQNNNEPLSGLDASLMGEIVIGAIEPDGCTRIAGNIFRNHSPPGSSNYSNIALYAANKRSYLNDDLIHWAFALNNCTELTPTRTAYRQDIDLNENKALNILGIFLGDISGNVAAQLPKKQSLDLQSVDIALLQGDIMMVPLKQTWESSEVKGVDIYITYPDQILEYQKYEKTEPFLNYSMEINSQTPGKIKLVIFSGNSNYSSGSAQLGQLFFKVIGSAGQSDIMQCIQFDVNELAGNGGMQWNGNIFEKIRLAVINPPDEDWIMISIPVHANPTSLTSICPTASLAYAYENQDYVAVDNLFPGKGYWVKTGSDGICNAKGNPYKYHIAKLLPGWHLIGSIDKDNVTPLTEPEGAIAEMYTYKNGAYERTTVIETGKAYWIKIIKSCYLILQ
jgi:hypothetical protein